MAVINQSNQWLVATSTRWIQWNWSIFFCSFLDFRQKTRSMVKRIISYKPEDNENWWETQNKVEQRSDPTLDQNKLISLRSIRLILSTNTRWSNELWAKEERIVWFGMMIITDTIVSTKGEFYPFDQVLMMVVPISMAGKQLTHCTHIIRTIIFWPSSIVFFLDRLFSLLFSLARSASVFHRTFM